ncbi:MAG: LysE/ArgO family amino acid transporter [Canibacter sp.]
MFAAWITGLFTGLGLIIAIGAQNAFVLRQGIKREHVLQIVLICSMTDAVLEFSGVAGIGFIVQKAPIVLEVVRWAGFVFLLWYGFVAFRRARKPSNLVAGGGPAISLKKAVLTALAITYLNPHVYLDTMVLMGSIGATQGDIGRWWFAFGGAVGSFMWFFLLGYGARLLTPIFARPSAWRVLDLLVGLTMWTIAASLAYESLSHHF